MTYIYDSFSCFFYSFEYFYLYIVIKRKKKNYLKIARGKSLLDKAKFDKASIDVRTINF